MRLIRVLFDVFLQETSVNNHKGQYATMPRQLAIIKAIWPHQYHWQRNTELREWLIESLPHL